MTAPAKKEWDSAFFGYPIATVELNDPATFLSDARQAREQAERTGIRLLYLFLPAAGTDLRDALRHEGFRDMGGKVDFSKIISAGAKSAPDPEIVPCHTNSPALERLAFQSGAHSRFRQDAGFRPGDFERLYREWLAGSLAGNDGKYAYVAGTPESPKGLLTLEPGATVRIGLFAVAPEHRRQGVGRRLVAQAERFCAERAAGKLRVATQIENREACRFYESCGFRNVHQESIFHAWLPAQAGRESGPEPMP